MFCSTTDHIILYYFDGVKWWGSQPPERQPHDDANENRPADRAYHIMNIHLTPL